MVAYCFQKIPQKGSPWSFLCYKVTSSLSCPKPAVLEWKSLPDLPVLFLCSICLCLLSCGIPKSTAVIWIYYDLVFIWPIKLSKTESILKLKLWFSVGHKPRLDFIRPCALSNLFIFLPRDYYIGKSRSSWTPYFHTWPWHFLFCV